MTEDIVQSETFVEIKHCFLEGGGQRLEKKTGLTKNDILHHLLCGDVYVTVCTVNVLNVGKMKTFF